jgi:hypothetical protein
MRWSVGDRKLVIGMSSRSCTSLFCQALAAWPGSWGSRKGCHRSRLSAPFHKLRDKSQAANVEA